MPDDDWFHEESDDPLRADGRNFYKVEKWSRVGSGLRKCCSLGTVSLSATVKLTHKIR
jgi:hypothetical protein